MLDGLAQGQAALGVDLGASEAPSEPVLSLASDISAPEDAEARTEAALDAVAEEPAVG